MENPFKEQQKGCILCNITVDYRNTQVSEDRGKNKQKTPSTVNSVTQFKVLNPYCILFFLDLSVTAQNFYKGRKFVTFYVWS